MVSPPLSSSWGLVIVEGQGRREVRTPGLWCRWFFCFFSYWCHVSCCLGLSALLLSFTLAMVTLLGGVVSLIGFWVVLGTNQFGRSKKSGSPKTPDSGVVVCFFLCSVSCCLSVVLAVVIVLDIYDGPLFLGNAVLSLGSCVWCCSLPPPPSGGAVLLPWVVLRSPPFLWTVLLWVVPRSFAWWFPSFWSSCSPLSPPFGGVVFLLPYG